MKGNSILKIPKKRGMNLLLGKHRSDLKLNWKQAKKKYPHMKAHHDSDFDGTLNRRDCRPLNPAADSKVGDWLRKRRSVREAKRAIKETPQRIGRRAKREVRLKIKTKRRERSLREWRTTLKKRERLRKGVVKFAKKELGLKGKPKQKYIRAVGRRISGEREKVGRKGKKYARAGRPAGVFKHTSPLTGKKVPATTFYKHRRVVRRRTKSMEELRDIREQRYLAGRHGISPQTTEAIQQAREQRLRPPEPEVEPEEQVQTMPTQPIQNGPVYPQEVQREVTELPERAYGEYPQQMKYKIVTDLMTGRKIIRPIPPKERWVE